jgi:hypothetical protein
MRFIYTCLRYFYHFSTIHLKTNPSCNQESLHHKSPSTSLRKPPRLLLLIAKMPITRRIGDEEESFEHLDDCHIFNAQTTVWVPHPYKDEKTGEMTATDFELDDMLSDYEIPTPFADHQEQVRQTAEYAAPQEDINDISASYVHIFSSGDDGIEHAECDDEESNLVENLGSTFKPTLEMARLGIPPKNDEREHKMLKKSPKTQEMLGARHAVTLLVKFSSASLMRTS